MTNLTSSNEALAYLPIVFEFIFEQISKIEEGVMSFKIALLTPKLQRESVELLRNHFKDCLASGRTDLVNTENHIRECIKANSSTHTHVKTLTILIVGILIFILVLLYCTAILHVHVHCRKPEEEEEEGLAR